MKHLIHIDIEDQELAIPTPEIAQERRVAIFDLLEENTFSLPTRSGLKPPKGPYKLILGIKHSKYKNFFNQHDPLDAKLF